MLAIDTETTGLDFKHGAKPFLVTVMRDGAESPEFVEWDVDPFTREPQIPDCDREWLSELMKEARDGCVFQNAKFDLAALTTVLPPVATEWPFERTEDTLYIAHLLASNQRKSLDALAMTYLGVDLTPYERAIDAAVTEARRYVRRKAFIEKHGEWRIAQRGLPEMPSAKDKVGKMDMWLPRTVARYEGFDPQHPWWTVLSDYANPDSATTLALWNELSRLAQDRGLWKLYQERRKLTQIVYSMEQQGIAVSRTRLKELQVKYEAESATMGERCCAVAASLDYELVLPKNGNSKSLLEFCFGREETVMDAHGNVVEVKQRKWLDLPVVGLTDSGNPSLDKAAMDEYKARLDERSRQGLFVKNLSGKRIRDTALTYMEGYERFGISLENLQNAFYQFSQTAPSIQLHPSRNLSSVDAQSNQELVRAMVRFGGESGPSNRLPTIQGSDSSGEDSDAHLRQSPLCQPETSDRGDTKGQHGRYGPKEPTNKSKGGKTPSSKINGGSGQNNQNVLQKEKREEGYSSISVSKVRSQSPSHVCHSPRGVLEAFDLRDWMILFPSLNATTTDTLRFSSRSPNEQNISKKEGFNLRYAFGPAPGREWWPMDAQNIELRLPAYLSGEPELIALFERPDDPPYYGSVHLLNFHTVFEETWEQELAEVGIDKVGPHCKKKYAATKYQNTKNGGFCKQYGGQRDLTDATFKRAGAFDLIEARFDRLAKLNQQCIAHANRYGYVETIPDKTVDPTRGYPLVCPRGDRGGVEPTKPLNYKIQGSAMWWTCKAMTRVSEFFAYLNAGGIFAGKQWSGGYWIAMQVHDELVSDMPSGKGRGKNPYSYNLPIAREVKRLMQLGGDDYGIPTPVGVEFCEHDWSTGVTIAV